MLERPNKEQNFIEKRREWKSGVDKPLGKRTLLLALPALVLCVFVMMSAPYLNLIVQKYSKEGDMMNLSLPLTLEDEVEPEEPAGPPPNPDDVMLQLYRERLDKEGVDWRSTPQVAGPNLDFAKETPIEVVPLDVELPATMVELERLAQPELD